MDQEPFPPPDFALLGFTALIELTMAEQGIDREEAIVFLEQHWEQTSLGGVRLNQDNDGDVEGDEDTPHPQEEDPPRENHGQAGQPVDAGQPAGIQTITFDPDAHIRPSPQGQWTTPSSTLKLTNMFPFGIFPGRDCGRWLVQSDNQTKMIHSQSPK